ncbi:hypothetical protein, partial [Pseudomonas laurylsulfatiphila]|uniref:hypothetical protein n=1 Tax=Pseudomonas laurylsulfatiphila TaxID=2011015 RepID=UPI003D0DD62D
NYNGSGRLPGCLVTEDEFESLSRSQGISLDPEVVNPDTHFSARFGMHAISRCNFLAASLLVITPIGALCR